MNTITGIPASKILERDTYIYKTFDELHGH